MPAQYYAHVNVLKNLAVLLEYIHLHHKNFNVKRFYLRISRVLHTTVAQNNNNHHGCSIRVY